MGVSLVFLAPLATWSGVARSQDDGGPTRPARNAPGPVVRPNLQTINDSVQINGQLSLNSIGLVQEIDINSGTNPGIAFQQTAPAFRWELYANESHWILHAKERGDYFPILVQAPASFVDDDRIGVRVGPNGNFGIHLPYDYSATPQAHLHIGGTATEDLFAGIGPSPGSGPALNFGYSGASFGRGSGFFNVRPDGAATAPNPSIRFATGNVQRLIVDNEGFIGIGTDVSALNPDSPIHHTSGARLTVGGTWQNASSRRLKHDITDLTSASARDAVERLRPVTFAYDADPDEKHVGFVAEEVPDLVASKDRTSLSPMDIVAVLTKVAQDQRRTIESQGRTLEEQRTMLARLLADVEALKASR